MIFHSAVGVFDPFSRHRCFVAFSQGAAGYVRQPSLCRTVAHAVIGDRVRACATLYTPPLVYRDGGGHFFQLGYVRHTWHREPARFSPGRRLAFSPQF